MQGEIVVALISCPECGKEVSDKAEICPNCGCPLENYEEYEEREEENDYDEEEDDEESKEESVISICSLILFGVAVVFTALKMVEKLRLKSLLDVQLKRKKQRRLLTHQYLMK